VELREKEKLLIIFALKEKKKIKTMEALTRMQKEKQKRNIKIRAPGKQFVQ
jgi:hypothetical protein